MEIRVLFGMGPTAAHTQGLDETAGPASEARVIPQWMVEATKSIENPPPYPASEVQRVRIRFGQVLEPIVAETIFVGVVYALLYVFLRQL